MLTTTAEKGKPILEKEKLSIAQSEHAAITTEGKSQSLKQSLKKLYLLISLIGVVLVIYFLFIGVRNQDVLMVECLKALLIVGGLNLIRAFSISKNLKIS